MLKICNNKFMEKAQYEKIKDIKVRMSKETEGNRLTTFNERNIVNIYNNRLKKKQSRKNA